MSALDLKLFLSETGRIFLVGPCLLKTKYPLTWSLNRVSLKILLKSWELRENSAEIWAKWGGDEGAWTFWEQSGALACN